MNELNAVSQTILSRHLIVTLITIKLSYGRHIVTSIDEYIIVTYYEVSKI